ncbi:translation initiation factor eIF 4e-like domain-containing protein [Xylariales sp. AK1849]|nr:translation initiation factor eIF 4e-like domain-containing protein [Xylariales sp. AK1849]
MDKNNSIWSRRSNTSNLSLSTSQNDTSTTARDFSSLSRRNGGTSSHGRANPFAATTPGGGLTSPVGGGGSSAFGLGSGAFASFGSAKTPKTPGNPFELALGSAGGGGKTPSAEKSSKDAFKSAIGRPATSTTSDPASSSYHLQDSWVFWTRPPISKANGYIEYDNTLHPMAEVSTAEEFWAVYKHLKPPSQLPLVTDYHLFKKDVRPIWEDEENKRGGKWVLRLKKGVADRYWEEILMACVGGQLCEDNEEVNGAVISVRNGEDIISIWTTSTGGKVLKIREMMKSLLKCPPETRFEFKTHDESMTQRATIDEQRRERAINHHHGDNQAGKRNLRHNDNPPSRPSQDEQRS